MQMGLRHIEALQHYRNSRPVQIDSFPSESRYTFVYADGSAVEFFNNGVAFERIEHSSALERLQLADPWTCAL